MESTSKFAAEKRKNHARFKYKRTSVPWKFIDLEKITYERQQSKKESYRGSDPKSTALKMMRKSIDIKQRTKGRRMSMVLLPRQGTPIDNLSEIYQGNLKIYNGDNTLRELISELKF